MPTIDSPFDGRGAKAGHTPGPWVARQEYANRWRIEQVPPVGMIPISVGLVCTTVLEVGTSDRNTAANARLIAACPTMFDALQELAETDGSASNIASAEILAARVRAVARAAIAAARGEAS